MAFGEMQIEVEVDVTGNAKIEVTNGDGSSCLKATKTIEEALGKVTKREMKAEGLKESHAGTTVKVGR